MLPHLCRVLGFLFFLVFFVPIQALPLSSVTVNGGGMQRKVSLGMTKTELIAELGAPSRIKSEGRCLQYDAFDMSLLLDDQLRVNRIYLGKTFLGELPDPSGRWVAAQQILAGQGPPQTIERLAYTPSPAIQNQATQELENRVGTAVAERQPLPLEYRGNGKLYELFSNDRVIKYKTVFDSDGIAFWMDHEKKLYATVLYQGAADALAVRKALGNVYFESNRFTIRDEFHPLLDRSANTLSERTDLFVTLAGHTDAIGTEAYNQALSNQRAQSVYDYLVRKGISAARLSRIGYGESRPAAGNTTPKGRAGNRRVELEAGAPQERVK